MVVAKDCVITAKPTGTARVGQSGNLPERYFDNFVAFHSSLSFFLIR